MKQTAILTDLDNTIYNWVDFFAPSFRAMVHAVAKKLDLNEDVIIEDFKDVYSAYRTLEYSFSVQQLRLCRDMSVEQVANLVRIAKGAFSRVRQKNLRPYPDVEETLAWAVRQGILIIAVTNAPFFQSQRRLVQLRCDKYFYGLAAWEGHDVPDSPWTKEIKQNSVAGKYQSKKIQRIWKLKEQELKPSPAGYLRIMKDLNLSPENIYVVGDSIQKDLAPAIQIGAKGVWARYGKRFDERNFQTLLTITHWDEAKIKSVYESESVKPTFIIDAFSRLKEIVPSPQPSLF